MSQLLRIGVLSLLVAFTAAALAAEPAGQGKTGTIQSVDAKAKTFVLSLEPRALTMTVNDKTVFTLDGAASTFEAAVKADLKATVTYTKSGDDRIASKVAVTSKTPAK